MLKGKTVVVGVCGGIAAFKAVGVVSKLKKMNAEVHVIMTDNAAKFVTPLTFQTISRNIVTTSMFAEPKSWDIKHLSLAERADLLVIAPATANIIGKVAAGIADDMLTTTVIATKAPVLFVPAMNTAMYENRIVQGNIKKLSDMGYMFMEPDIGMLAEGTCGKGRLPEAGVIVEEISSLLRHSNRDMAGIRVMITAGPTREPIDPVRYVTNRSSGKMGYAVASNAAGRGAEVKLISGPVNVPGPHNVNIVNIKTAQEMYDAVMAEYVNYDVLIMAAAVADYRCADISDKKIKKTGDELTVRFIKNPDIAEEVGKHKGKRIHVGMCAETNDLVENAKVKIKAKNFDLIMANDVTMEGAGFETDTNIVKIIRRDGTIKELSLMSKDDVAEHLLDEVMLMFKV